MPYQNHPFNITRYLPASNQNQGYFITGTDTGIGKTWIAQLILQQLNKQNYSTIGLKPIASGSEITPAGLRNADALALQKVASISLAYEQVNPYTFAPPIAPHIAAEQVGVTLSVKALLKSIQSVRNQYPEAITVVEGVGGLLVPLNTTETVSNLAAALDLPVILVVGIRLGCLNHALLTWTALRQSEVNLLGWVANMMEPPSAVYQENIQTLIEWINAPYLGQVDYQESITELAH